MTIPRLRRKRPLGFLLLGLLALILGACSSAGTESTAAPVPNLAPTEAVISQPAATAAPAISQTVEPMPEGLALLKRLILNQPIVTGIANDSAQTAAITIPTMF